MKMRYSIIMDKAEDLLFYNEDHPNCERVVDPMCIFKENDVVLFQGDSITDVGRDREISDNLGQGYAMMAAALFTMKHPEKNVTFLNRGISGNRVKHLQARWQADCIDLKPDWVSILVGINDCANRYTTNDPTSVEDYKNGYRQLIEQVKKELNAGIILCEPFLQPIPEERAAWREDLDPKIQAVRELAAEYKTLYVALDGIIATASIHSDPAIWLPKDGVHPSKAGHALIAKHWLTAVGVQL